MALQHHRAFRLVMILAIVGLSACIYASYSTNPNSLPVHMQTAVALVQTQYDDKLTITNELGKGKPEITNKKQHIPSASGKCELRGQAL